MPAAAPRHLQRGHFAFMRARVQGVDERASWERYLRLEGEHSDPRTVRRTIGLDPGCLCGRRPAPSKMGTPRLMLLDAQAFSPEKGRPSPKDFARQ